MYLYATLTVGLSILKFCLFDLQCELCNCDAVVDVVR